MARAYEIYHDVVVIIQPVLTLILIVLLWLALRRRT